MCPVCINGQTATSTVRPPKWSVDALVDITQMAIVKYIISSLVISAVHVSRVIQDCEPKFFSYSDVTKLSREDSFELLPESCDWS